MIKPHYEDKELGIELYQGDCIDILPQLYEKYHNQITCVCTDPPYGIKYVSNHRTTKDILGQAIANDDNLDVLGLAMPFLKELMMMNSAGYFFAHPNMIGENRLIFDKYLTYKNTLIWDKGDAGTFGDLEAAYSLNYEVVFYYNKGRRKLNGSRPRTILRYLMAEPHHRKMDAIEKEELIAAVGELLFHMSEEQREKAGEMINPDILQKALSQYPKSKIRKDWSSRQDPVHPTVKPVSLLATLLKNSTNEGDIVLDPFMGSGTCGAAAKALGRRFVGIELRPAFMNHAISRIHKQGLFDKPLPTPIQDKLF